MHKILIILALLTAPVFAQHYSLGWKSDPKHSKGLKQFVRTGLRADTIKPFTDLSASLPTVYDQGAQGACTAHAGVAAFELPWKQKHGKFLKGSRQGLYIDALKYDGTYPNDAGSYISTIVWVLSNKGVGKESCFPYVGYPWGPIPKCYEKDAAKNKMTQSYDVDSTDGKSIRIALSNGFSVMFGGYVYNDIQTLKKPYILPSPKGNPIGGHAMLIVGHDDTKKLYKVRNSWGTLWGDKGYFYIKYADMHNPRIYEDFAAVQLTN